MSTATVEQLEADIRQLSLAEQLLLMERLVQSIRHRTVATSTEDQLAAMANDPDIQRELRLIANEFAGTEADGLDAAA